MPHDYHRIVALLRRVDDDKSAYRKDQDLRRSGFTHRDVDDILLNDDVLSFRLKDGRSWSGSPDDLRWAEVQALLQAAEVKAVESDLGLSGRSPKIPEIPAIKQFGKELREFINSDDVFSILPEGDWGASGCWILAEALKRFLGPPAELWAVYSSVLPVEHVVVKDGDAYFDYNGASTKQEILSEFASSYPNRTGIGLARLTTYRAKRAHETGIPCEPWLVKPLVSKLNARFRQHDSH